VGRTRVYWPEPEGASAGDDADLLQQILDRSARYRTFCELRTFTQATGRTVRIWLHPWYSEPAEARVLVTPPPWSVS
jgi:hypothetical protein